MASTKPLSITIAELKKKIKSGDIAPIYIAQGDEPYLLDEVADLIETKLVDESTRDFNFDQFHGDDLQSEHLASSLTGIPMMAERRVVIIRKAEKLAPTIQKYLDSYMKSPSPDTCLLMLYEGDQKKAWIKKALKTSVTIRCNTPDKRGLRAWINSYAKKIKLNIHPDALDMMLEERKPKLIDVAAELEKASLLLDEDGELTLPVLQQVWGIQSEVDIWQFFNEVASGKRLAALNSFNDIREEFPKEKTAGFTLSQVSRKLRLVLKEKEYNRRQVPPYDRVWSGNTKNQWRFAPDELKRLDSHTAELALLKLHNLDKLRKTRAFDATLLFEQFIHFLALSKKVKR